MATEQEYDDIIAPMLADVAAKCKELGMSITARVEWEPGEAGITRIGISEASGIEQRMTDYAALSRGNLDALIMSMRKAGINMDQTVVGSLFNKHT